jgi:hypothetical protein
MLQSLQNQKFSQHHDCTCSWTALLISGLIFLKNLDKVWSLGSINHNKITWKWQTGFDWVCTWELKKRNMQHPSRPLVPVWAIFNFLTLKSAGIIDPEEPENITTLKGTMEQLISAATQHLTSDVVKYKNLN